MNNPSLDYINNRMSLRKPQTKSLEILDTVIDDIFCDKTNDEKVKVIKKKYNWFVNFDRDFPSLCFSLATGVGKTRLMGAFIVYLYLTQNIKNFMIIAPNITIYNKLKKDFSDITSDKYVFKGIQEFISNTPKIVTGENYENEGDLELWESNLTINIFNIDKINKDEQSIKSINEQLKQSYYDFLCEQKDLVLLMDESHHYRASKGMQVLNELNPILGLELTATPQIEKNGKTLRFNNIIYDYPLREALNDGYVKDPFVATKKDFNSTNFSDDELDKIKIVDGIRIHQNTKIKLEEYAKTNEKRLVKPFAMIICKNIEHGEKIMNYIQSNEFFDGYYKDKVLFINSKNGSSEKDENIQKLLLLEHPLNKIEIVVHVNMLKEGWDVTNLYTIIPLRTSASQTLTEQTIGRGLRLPYGKRVGNDIVDGLTIVSHDKYQEIVNEAHATDSIFNTSNIFYIEDVDLNEKELITTQYSWEVEFDNKINAEDNLNNKIELSLEKEIMKEIAINKKNDLEHFSKKNIIDNIIENTCKTLEVEDKKIVEEKYQDILEKDISKLIKNFYSNSINIPYVSINKQTTVEQVYKDFKFDYKNILNYTPLHDSMIIQHLDDGDTFEIKFDNVVTIYDNYKELLFEKILMSPSIEYEKCADILNEKIDEYLELLKEKYSNDDIISIIFYYSKYIVKEFIKQFNENVELISNTYEEPIINEHSKILNSNFTKYKTDDILDFKSVIPIGEITKKVFTGYKKSYHNMYKFDSSTEKDFSIILENSEEVIKWLRPAPNQFNIYWNNINKYEPDFIVETKNVIYMIEIKAQNQIGNEEVQLKKKAAENYCEIINSNCKNMKKWKYMIIADDEVKTNYSFGRYSEVD